MLKYSLNSIQFKFDPKCSLVHLFCPLLILTSLTVQLHTGILALCAFYCHAMSLFSAACITFPVQISTHCLATAHCGHAGKHLKNVQKFLKWIEFQLCIKCNFSIYGIDTLTLNFKGYLQNSTQNRKRRHISDALHQVLSSLIQWYCRYLKIFLLTDMETFIPYSPYWGCWWPDNSSQCISTTAST